jgi:hypothetical protein
LTCRVFRDLENKETQETAEERTKIDDKMDAEDSTAPKDGINIPTLPKSREVNGEISRSLKFIHTI